ncbi:MAG: ATPase, T2SS/T4P/T4SS family, partial [Candidatus Limnocylindrales bacterium]|nr:ATPase, T2SS/T4P/T4SS family [Candidatus Limnocylindrales bacterium]
MSLLQRVERAQRGIEIPSTGALVPVGPAAPRPAPPAARGDSLREIRARLHDDLIRAYDTLREAGEGVDLRAKVEAIVDRAVDAHGLVLSRDERRHLVEELADDLTGFGPLEPFLRDESITEVMVNGPDHIYIERHGKIERVESTFLSDEHVLRIIDRIITPMGRRIDAMSPRVDARLPDGSRVNAIIEPLSLVGPVITVRKFAARPFTVEDLVRFGTATAEMFDFLRACVEARLNIFVSGGTGSGKTTTLNVMSSFIPEDERIITIEDAAELQLRQVHVVTLESRPANL